MFTKTTWLLSLITILILGLAACSQPAAGEEPLSSSNVSALPAEPAAATQDTAVSPQSIIAETEETVADTAVLPAQTLSTTTLTDAEIEALQFMREEEKLARDVYLVMYDLWGIPVFQNIAGSEQVHTDAVLALLQAWDLADPAAGLAPGEFANADLQALYDQLIDMGSQSLEDALLVGALVEETDIADLEERLAVVEDPQIIQVFTNLDQGSQSHLRSYVGLWEQQTGETYQPAVLDAAAFADILAGSNGNGNGNGSGGQGKGNGQGQGGQGKGNGQGQGNGRGHGGNGGGGKGNSSPSA
jgi:hypothetical protein